jgi:hypothetical protein
MSWTEIEDETKRQQIEPDSIIFKTHMRQYGKVKHYHLTLCIGRALIQYLNWSRTTKVKFAWGIGEHRGKVRILPVTSNNGCSVKIGVDRGVISNKALPRGVYQIERVLTIAHTIGSLENTDTHYIEIDLPADFYTGRSPLSDADAQSILTQLSSLPQNVAPEQPVRLGALEKTRSPFDNSPTQAITPKRQPETSLVSEVPKIQPTPIVTLKQVFEPLPSPFRVMEAPKPAPVNRPIPEVRTPANFNDGNPLVDIAAICRYITLYVGDDAKPTSARTVIINDVIKTHVDALKLANLHRTVQKLPPFQLRQPV